MFVGKELKCSFPCSCFGQIPVVVPYCILQHAQRITFHTGLDSQNPSSPFVFHNKREGMETDSDSNGFEDEVIENVPSSVVIGCDGDRIEDHF